MALGRAKRTRRSPVNRDRSRTVKRHSQHLLEAMSLTASKQSHRWALGIIPLDHLPR